MSETRAAERRLAAILIADVSGYSRLVQQDEAATVARLAALRQEIEAALADRGGRVVSSAGDGFLAVFGSALEAAAAALEIQHRVLKRQRDIPEAQQIRFRIGLNLGDVLVQEDDLFGDAINVTARLQELAAPGGICASRSLRDSVRGRFPCAFERVGKRQVKNIARPVTVYRLLPPGTKPPTRWGAAAAALATVIIIVGVVLWASLPSPHDEPAQAPPAAALRPPAAKPVSGSENAGRNGEPKPPQSIEGTASDPDAAASRSQGGN